MMHSVKLCRNMNKIVISANILSLAVGLVIG